MLKLNPSAWAIFIRIVYWIECTLQAIEINKLEDMG